MFAVDGLAQDDDGIRAHMTTGPWMSRPGDAGSIGILADNVLGYALIASAPGELYSVSTEISLDFLRPLPRDGTRLSAVGRIVHTGAAAGLAEGSIVDQRDRLIARCRQWGRFVDLRQGSASSGNGAVAAASERDRLPAAGEHIGALREAVTASEGRAKLELRADDDLMNPIGTLHGGVTLWVTGLVASAAVSSLTTTLVPASMTVSYLRPFLRGDLATFHADVVSCGRSLALTRVTGSNQAGKPCTVARVQHHNPH